MRVLAVTKIFPNSLEPLSSPFNRQQFAELANSCDLTVLEAIPYVPGATLTGQPPRAAKLAALPARETVGGIDVVYMRQLYVPRFGLPFAMPLYLASLAPFRKLARSYDVVLATWAYPDGCASIVFAHALDKPCVVKCHGTDVNVVAKSRAVRPILRRVLPRADAMIAVSRPMADELTSFGVPRDRIHVVANGVDTALFQVRDRAAARRALGIPLGRPLILFVGRLEPQKGLGELLDAFGRVRAMRPEAILALVGDGVSRDSVNAKKAEWGDALLAPGARPLTEVAQWMTACDLFVLPSWNEGTPNVVLEALASGRPAVGTRVGGIPDVLADPRSGLLVPVKDAAALAEAIVTALARRWDPRDVAACGPTSWKESAAKVYDVLETALVSSGRSPVK